MTHLTIPVDHLNQLLVQVVQDFLGIEFAGEAAPDAKAPCAGDSLGVRLTISDPGLPQPVCEMRLVCTPALADQLAATMFRQAPATLSVQHREDALGEVGNIVAGNLKALLAAARTEPAERAATLSLPAVSTAVTPFEHPACAVTQHTLAGEAMYLGVWLEGDGGKTAP